jgi:septum formation protein
VALRRLILASASPARLRLLRSAGFDPDVVVSGVDESDIEPSRPHEAALTLAVRKAEAVAARLADDAAYPPALIVGCDSVLDVDGVAYGKPASKAEALQRWYELRGRDAVLRTGHCVIDLGATAATREPEDEGLDMAMPPAAEVAATVVRFGNPTDDEIARYVGTGEPLGVAGAFTIDGWSAPFIDGVDGDPGNVIGLSLPLLRTLVARFGLSITDLWP